METIFIKRFIKTEADLPKEKGVYEALYSDQKTFGKTLYDSSPSCNIWWTNNVYWYQKPTTLAELIKEKLKDELLKYDIHHGNSPQDSEKWVDEYLNRIMEE